MIKVVIIIQDIQEGKGEQKAGIVVQGRVSDDQPQTPLELEIASSIMQATKTIATLYGDMLGAGPVHMMEYKNGSEVAKERINAMGGADINKEFGNG